MGTGLSKSKYVTFCNCPKALWLKVNKPDKEIIDPAVASRFEEGNIVGDLAMEYFGKFVEVTSFDSNGKLDLTAMIKKTNDEIANGTKVICEASFTVNGNYCAVDILKKNGKSYDIYEVKSSTDAEKEVYYRDVAYQKWVLEKCGLDIKNVYLMNINSDYVMEDELDIKKLFKVTLLNNVIEPYYKDVSKNVTVAKKVLQSTDEPICPFGVYCFNPYDCGFFNYCTKGMKRPNVLDLYRLPNKKKVEYLNDNIKTFRQLKNKELNKIQKMQISAELDGEEFIDKKGIKSFLDTLKYPLYFLILKPYNQCYLNIKVLDHISKYHFNIRYIS